MQNQFKGFNTPREAGPKGTITVCQTKTILLYCKVHVFLQILLSVSLMEQLKTPASCFSKRSTVIKAEHKFCNKAWVVGIVIT